jgi:toxin FitB
MILLDTNVLSEMMKLSPAPAVAAWMAGADPEGLFTTVISEAEIRLGIELLPDGRRKRELQHAAERIIALFDARILSFDSMATGYFAQIVAGRRRMGLPIGDLDAQIAAVARSHDMALATRNILDFRGTGITVLDPWSI